MPDEGLSEVLLTEDWSITDPENTAFPLPVDWVGAGLSKREYAAIEFVGRQINLDVYLGCSDRRASMIKNAIALTDELLAKLNDGGQDEL